MRRLAVIVAAAALACCGPAALAFVPTAPRHGLSSSLRQRARTASIQPAAYRASFTRRAAAVDPEAVSTAVTVAAQGAAAASPFVAKIVNNLSSVAVLALIIAVHELGHFLAAISQGIRVKNFSIGFGPTLLSVKPGDPTDEDAIEYTVRAIPAGGFVSFPQHYEVDDDGEIIRCVLQECVR